MTDIAACGHAFDGVDHLSKRYCAKCGVWEHNLDEGLTRFVKAAPRICPCGIVADDCTYHRSAT